MAAPQACWCAAWVWVTRSAVTPSFAVLFAFLGMTANIRFVDNMSACLAPQDIDVDTQSTWSIDAGPVLSSLAFLISLVLLPTFQRSDPAIAPHGGLLYAPVTYPQP